jgi:hypothetical protein
MPSYYYSSLLQKHIIDGQSTEALETWSYV